MNSLQRLKHACELHGQREVARRIKRSPTAVNQTLHGKYYKPESIFCLVDDVFKELNESDAYCPILGSIHKDTCKRYRELANAGAVKSDRLYRSVKELCLTCQQGRKDERA